MNEATIATGLRRPWLRRVRLRRPGVITVAALFLVVVAVLALFGPALAPIDPSQVDVTAVQLGPSGQHLLGTDALGRDVFSRILAGARSAVVGPLLIAVGSMVIGDLLGLASGYLGGRVDWLIMRWVDLMWSMPSLFVVIVVAGITGGGYWVAVGLLLLFSIPYDTRLIRAVVLAQRNLPYIEAAEISGQGKLRIMLVHLWPNVLPVAVSNAFLNFPYALISLVSLSFLGLGVPPGAADWGQMLNEGRAIVYTNGWLLIGSAVMVVATAVSMNLVGDKLQERFADVGTIRA
ncbi:MAG: ABC transporter permease [Solirubrobacterales bacterium]